MGVVFQLEMVMKGDHGVVTRRNCIVTGNPGTGEQSTQLLTGHAPDCPAEGWLEAPQRSRWLRVSVTETATGRTKLTLRLPVGLLDIALKLGANLLPGASEAEVAALLRSVRDDHVGSATATDDLDRGERMDVAIE